MRKLLFCALIIIGILATLTANPQTAHVPIQPLQAKACQRPTAVCHFDNPVTAGGTLVAVAIGACNASGCNTVRDANGDTWQIAFIVDNYNGLVLYYALAAKGGNDTVYFTGWPQGDWAALIAEYPPSTGLDFVIENGVRYNAASQGNYGPQNLHPLGHLGSSDIGWAIPLEATESCELLLAWGNSGSYDLAHFQDAPIQPIAGPGFTVRAQEYGWISLEDMTTTTPGLYLPTIGWTGYGHWDLGGALFKMGNCK